MDKILQYIGLARRANKVLFGDEILEAFSRNKVKLLFLASDISAKSRERFAKKCASYHIMLIESYNAETLAAAVGRNLAKTIAISDEGFAQAIQKERRCMDGKNPTKKCKQ